MTHVQTNGHSVHAEHAPRQPPRGLRRFTAAGWLRALWMAPLFWAIGAGLVCAARGVLRRSDRTAWILAGIAVLAWGIGDTVWTFTVADLRDPPFPSYADIGFLCVYPPAYGAIVLLLRGRVGRLHTSLWLDGVIGGLAVAAVGTAVVFQAVLKMIGGSPAAVATNLAYPLADLTLIALVVWALGVVGWRPGRAWGLIAAGLRPGSPKKVARPVSSGRPPKDGMPRSATRSSRKYS